MKTVKITYFAGLCGIEDLLRSRVPFSLFVSNLAFSVQSGKWPAPSDPTLRCQRTEPPSTPPSLTKPLLFHHCTFYDVKRSLWHSTSGDLHWAYLHWLHRLYWGFWNIDFEFDFGSSAERSVHGRDVDAERVVGILAFQPRLALDRNVGTALDLVGRPTPLRTEVTQSMPELKIDALGLVGVAAGEKPYVRSIL